MSNQAMFIKLVLKSLNGKKTSLLAGFLALFLASMLVSALLAVVLDLPNSLGRELRHFGANFILKAPKKPLTSGEIKKLGKPPFSQYVVAYAPFASVKIRKGFNTYQLIGTDLKALKKLSPWIKFSEGSLKENQMLAGADVARQLGLKRGKLFNFTGYESLVPRKLQKTGCLSCHKSFSPADHSGELSTPPKISECSECHDPHEKRKRYQRKLLIAGFVSSGGDEDNHFYTKSDTIFKSGLGNGFQSASLSVLTSKITEKSFSSLVKKNFKNAGLKSVKQISQAEASLLSKIKLLMTLLTVVVLAGCGLSVTSTLSGIVMERRTEIGLMKAIGAGHGSIIILFIGELVFLALLAGILGYFGGLGLALLLAGIVFKAKVSANFFIGIVSIVAALALVNIASIAPVRSALRIEPAQTLRGE